MIRVVKGSASKLIASPSGEFRLVRIPNESYRAFVPRGLTKSPPIELLGADALLNDEARGALARLDGLSQVIPDADLFINMYLRKEALLSAQIEGTQSSLSDLLLFEDSDDEQTDNDAVEVTIKTLPLSTRLFNEIHGRLLEHGRGRELQPGTLLE